VGKEPTPPLLESRAKKTIEVVSPHIIHENR